MIRRRLWEHAAEDERLSLAEKWGKKYPVAVESRQNNWEELSEYFRYTPAIRKLLYTANTVGGVPRQGPKAPKTKGAFTGDMALLKPVYPATKNIEKK